MAFGLVALALVVAGLLLERQARRHDKLVERLVSELTHAREDGLVERGSLLNRIAAPQLLQQVAPASVVHRATAAAADRPPVEQEDEQLALVGAVLPEVVED